MSDSSAAMGANANMLARDPYHLNFVLMPLVKMLVGHNLSWSEREMIVHAIIATTVHHKGMADEAQMHDQGAVCGFSRQRSA